jgi:hypothetical protein
VAPLAPCRPARPLGHRGAAPGRAPHHHHHRADGALQRRRAVARPRVARWREQPGGDAGQGVGYNGDDGAGHCPLRAGAAEKVGAPQRAADLRAGRREAHRCAAGTNAGARAVAVAAAAAGAFSWGGWRRTICVDPNTKPQRSRIAIAGEPSQKAASSSGGDSRSVTGCSAGLPPPPPGQPPTARASPAPVASAPASPARCASSAASPSSPSPPPGRGPGAASPRASTQGVAPSGGGRAHGAPRGRGRSSWPLSLAPSPSAPSPVIWLQAFGPCPGPGGRSFLTVYGGRTGFPRVTPPRDVWGRRHCVPARGA